MSRDSAGAWLIGATVLGFFLARYWREHKRKEEQARETAEREPLFSEGPKAQHPQIASDACIGCGGCVSVCPEGDVLAVVNGKATIVNGHKCIGHGLCAEECPVGAITMVMAKPSSSADMPVISDEFETSVPNLFILGELGGLALIKNAVNQGRDCVDVVARRLSSSPRSPVDSAVWDLIVVGNTSSPPRTQFSKNTFEIVLPEGALLDEAAATRPGGLGTRTHLISLSRKGHYAFNVPIQPDQGEKETLFEVQYHFAYNGSHQLAAHPQMAVVIYTAKGIKFTAKDSSRFKAAQEDPRVDTHVVHNVLPGDEIAFTVSGEGQMPPDATRPSMQPPGGAAAGMPGGVAAGMPGGGIGAPIASPDPLTGSKTWLLSAFAIVLAALTFLFLRRRNAAPIEVSYPMSAAMPGPDAFKDHPVSHSQPVVITQSPRDTIMLETLKNELLALEQDKIIGKISAEEYVQVRAGLEALLKRAVGPKTG